VTETPVCSGLGGAGVDVGSAVAGGAALVIGAAASIKPTVPIRDKKLRREVEPRSVGASVANTLFLLVSSDMFTAFVRACSGALADCAVADSHCDQPEHPHVVLRRTDIAPLNR